MRKTRRIIISDGRTHLTLDVNPARLAIEYPQQTRTLSLISGEYVEMGEKGLARVALETFLPAAGSPFKSSPLSMEGWRETLRLWKEAGTSLNVVISGVLDADFYMSAYRETVSENDADTGVAMEFIERRQLAILSPSPAYAPQRGGGEIPGGYTVVKGDNLHKIAKRVYGDASKWRDIYEANKGDIGDPDLIYPGQELTLP